MRPGIDEMYRRFFPTIREKCARMLKDRSEAQDVAQDTFERLCRAGPRGRDLEQVTAWIYRTSTRLAIDRMRWGETRAPHDGDGRAADASEIDLAGPGVEEAVVSRHELVSLAQAVPRQELELAILARVDGLTQREIAEVTGVSDRHVRRLLTRFDARLEQWRRLGGYEDD